jgi:hypothetical protein
MVSMTLAPEMPFSFLWRLVHAVNYFLGGFFFILGTMELYPTPAKANLLLGALFYTIGSCTFLLADAQEWGTWRKGCFPGLYSGSRRPSVFSDAVEEARLLGALVDGPGPAGSPVGPAGPETWWSTAELPCNLFASATGSFLYVVGSVGFFPRIAAKDPAVGLWGFIIGSSFIFFSQLFKVHRIMTTDPETGERGFRWANIKTDSHTAFHLEFWAGVGGLCFLFGTIMYLPQHFTEALYRPILNIWMAGSISFQLSGLVLFYRHMSLKL